MFPEEVIAAKNRSSIASRVKVVPTADLQLNKQGRKILTQSLAVPKLSGPHHLSDPVD